MAGAVTFQIGRRQPQESGSRARAVFLQVNEGAGELDQALIEGVVRASFLEPERFKHLVGLEKPALVKGMDEGEKVRIQVASLKRGNELRDTVGPVAHWATVNAEAEFFKWLKRRRPGGSPGRRVRWIQAAGAG